MYLYAQTIALMATRVPKNKCLSRKGGLSPPPGLLGALCLYSVLGWIYKETDIVMYVNIY